MGVPFTVFCSSGHIVEINHGGEIDISKLKCPCCNSKKFTIECNWSQNIHRKIPLKPIGKDWIKLDNEEIKGESQIDVYDVGKVDNWIKLTEDEECICIDCEQKFNLTGKEKDWYKKKGLQLPKRCKGCREDRKNPEKARQEYIRLKKKFEKIRWE